MFSWTRLRSVNFIVIEVHSISDFSQDGGQEGLNILLEPNWELLTTVGPWVDAAGQIFYSFGLSYGGVIAFSSYNPIDQNLYRDAFIIAFFNCGTSVFAACVIFALLGFKAKTAYYACTELQIDIMSNANNWPEDTYTKGMVIIHILCYIGYVTYAIKNISFN